MAMEQVSHYRIISKLGSGGMGEVYLAEDQRLGRRVALKLLPERYTKDPERVRRFEQEARTISALSHPNIITIYEIGQTPPAEGGRHYIVTEYIEGETLRELLQARSLSLAEALNLAAQTATALVAAHGAGVTHRDIKPENVMVRPDGYLKVLDFGLAKLTEGARSSRPPDPASTQAETASWGGEDWFMTRELGREPRTNPGVILGTLSYMSPEQARGLKVDARSDLFSLGVVLYEMVAGRAPFQANTSGDMIVQILDREPPPLRRFAPQTPDDLLWIVAKALAKEREARYQSAKDLLDDLKRAQRRLEFATSQGDDTGQLPGLATNPLPSESDKLARESGSGRMPSGAQRALNSSGSQPLDSLAVLPLADHSASHSQDANAVYLCEGIPESLILNLSRLAQLRVMAWSTVARFQKAQGQQLDALAIGRELGVRAVLAGRLYQFGDNLVIKIELVDTADGAQLWGEQYQRKLADLLTLEEEISREICEKLRLRLDSEERKRLAKRYTENHEAYQAYLRGRHYWKQRTAQALRKGIESFQQAIALDENYALAYTGLSDCYALVSIYGAAPPRAIMPKARAAALKALELDDSLAEAHTSLAVTQVWFDWDWAGAERAFQRAFELNPNYSVAWHWYGSVLLSARGRHDEALEAEQRALALEPFTLIYNLHPGFICYQAGRYDEAIGYYRHTLELDEQFVLAHFYLGLAYAQKGEHAAAIASLKRALELAGGRGALIQAALAYAYARAGERAEAQGILQQLRSFPLNRDVSPFYLALIYAGLGEREAALKALQDAVAEKFSWLVWLKSEPMFASIRDDARYQALIDEMSLR